MPNWSDLTTEVSAPIIVSLLTYLTFKARAIYNTWCIDHAETQVVQRSTQTDVSEEKEEVDETSSEVQEECIHEHAPYLREIDQYRLPRCSLYSTEIPQFR